MSSQAHERIKLIKDGTVAGTVPIENDLGEVIGELRAITVSDLQDTELLDSLASWRDRFMKFFLTQFESTRDRTHGYLRDIVLAKPDRILFTLHDDSGNRIGNLGLCDVTPESAELDNFLRGEPGGGARLFFFAELALMRWAIRELGVTRFSVKILTFNWLSLDLHQQVGFKIARQIALEKLEQNGVTSHRFLTDETGNVDYRCVEMTLSAEEFWDKNQRRHK